MRLTIIGSGYVGFVSGACFSEFGFEVDCVDNNQEKIAKLKQGLIPIYEPGLDSLVKRGLQTNRLRFTSQLDEAVKDADVVMLAVGTPEKEENSSADLSFVYQAVKDIAPYLTPYTVIVTKSTVPIGTGKQVRKIIKERRPDLTFGEDIDIASNPEFLREGSAINDFMRPDRIVVGTDSPRAREIMQRLYRPLYLIETPIVYTSIQTAELIKYAANSFLALKIGFINQIADLCEEIGGDVQEVAKAIGLDNRIGRKFLHAGPGYGGSCFPKDTRALSCTAKELGRPMSLVDAVINSNEQRKNAIAQKIIDNVPKGCSIGVLGITFKPNTDDTREAPSLTIIPKLLSNGFNLNIYDPMYFKGTTYNLDFQGFQGVEWCENPYDAATGTQALVILTEWNEFRALDLERIQKLMQPNASIFDFRNIYKPSEMTNFTYYAVGKGFFKKQA